jgi:integrase
MNGSKRARSKTDDRGRCSWELRVPMGGVDPATARRRYARRSFRGTAAEADTELAALVTEVITHRREAGAATPTGGTFNWVLDQWLAAKAAIRKPSTVHGYTKTARLYVRAFTAPGEVVTLGETKLEDLTVGHFDALYGSMATRKLAPATIARAHEVCRGAFNFAIRRGWYIRTNPAVLSERPSVKRKRKLTIPDPAKVTTMLTAYGAVDPDMATAFWVASSVGSRRSMGLGLRWRNIDFDRDTVDLIGSVVAVGNLIYEDEFSNKEDEEYTVDLDPWTMHMLTLHRDRCTERAALAETVIRPGSYVFSPDPDGTAPMDPNAVTKTWRRVADAHGLDGVRLNDLRHMVATSLLRAGVPIEVVSKRLGHAHTSITQDIYSHVLDETAAREAADIMGRLMNGADAHALRKKAHKKKAKDAKKARASITPLLAVSQ